MQTDHPGTAGRFKIAVDISVAGDGVITGRAGADQSHAKDVGGNQDKEDVSVFLSSAKRPRSV